MTDTADLFRRAADELGFHLRPDQRRSVAALVSGRDALVVMPTGAGKSAIYQVAGAGLEGCTVVVSPLLALQDDQVASIGDRFGGAAAIDSHLSATARTEVLDRMRRGEVEFVLVAPEQLANEEVVAAVLAARPSLLVVDEAHCVSTWGHDFRPDYLALGRVVELIGRPVVLALTASAAPPVRDEIVERLGLTDPEVLVTGFERPEVRLEVRHEVDQRSADQRVVDLATSLDGRGLVYVARRADAERLAAEIEERGRPAAAYHGGMPRARREEVLARFAAEPDLSVVATNAFGMGIDVPDVRFVLHAEPPESLDAYYQEVGRAGRDGEPSVAVCCTVTGQASRRRAGGGGGGDPEEALAVLAAVRAGATSQAKLAEATGIGRRRLLPIVADLEVAGLVRRAGRRLVDAGSDDLDRLERVRDQRSELATTRREMLRRYLEGDRCRWHQLLAYFGEASPGRCGHCDVCERSEGTADEMDGPFPVGAAVDHETFGRGTVVDRDEDHVTVLFDDSGYRVLDAGLAVDGLLVAADDPPGGPGAAG